MATCPSLPSRLQFVFHYHSLHLFRLFPALSVTFLTLSFLITHLEFPYEIDHISPLVVNIMSCDFAPMYFFFLSIFCGFIFSFFPPLVRRPVGTDWKIGIGDLVHLSMGHTKLGFTSMSSVRSWAQTSIHLTLLPFFFLPQSSLFNEEDSLLIIFTHRKQLILFSILDKPHIGLIVHILNNRDGKQFTTK